MSTGLVVEFSLPRHGWLQLTLTSGDQRHVIPVSQTPFDSLEELASAVSAFLEAARAGTVHISSEPDEWQLVFTPIRRGELRLEVLHSASRGLGTDRLLLHEGDAVHAGRVFWRALRKLESQFLPDHWSHPFPSRLVAGLERLTARERS